MFSSRLNWQTKPNKLNLLLQEKKRKSDEILDLTISNPTQVHLFSKQAKTELLSSLHNRNNLVYQPKPQGIKESREAIALDYQTKNIQVDPSHLLLCASTSEAYAFLFQLLCNPGEEILFPQPSYPLFEHLAGLSSIKQKFYSLYFDDRFWIHFDSIEESYSNKSKALLVVHPNNPTGSFLSNQEANTLLSFCEEKNLPLIVDEVFFDYAFPSYEGSFTSFLKLASARNILCFVLSGISKVLGLPQLKLSWITILGPEPLRRQAQTNLELISDTFLSVSTPTQWSIYNLLPKRNFFQGPIQNRLVQNLTTLQTLLKNTACQLLPIEGGFSAVLQLPHILSEEEWVLLFLQEDNILCHPGYFFDFVTEPYVVLSLLTEPNLFKIGISRLLHRVDKEI